MRDFLENVNRVRDCLDESLNWIKDARNAIEDMEDYEYDFSKGEPPEKKVVVDIPPEFANELNKFNEIIDQIETLQKRINPICQKYTPPDME